MRNAGAIPAGAAVNIRRNFRDKVMRLSIRKSKPAFCIAGLLLIAALCAVMFAANGSLALFTDSPDPAVNHFSVGNTKVQINEPEYVQDADGHNAVRPQEAFKKDPYIENVGSVDAYVFMKVTVPKAEVMTYSGGGAAKNAAAVTQLFTLLSESGAEGINSGWSLISSDDTGEQANVYVYAYGSASTCTNLSPGTETAKPLFSKARLASIIEGQGLDDSVQNITLEAYSVQSENLPYSAPQDIWGFLASQITEDSGEDAQ